jgi:hypothetical protein
MKKRWAIAGTLAAMICASLAVVGTAEASTGPRAIQIGRTYDKCSPNSVCLYQNGNGTGSKLILPSAAYATWNMRDLPFRNGQSANDQISSIYNNTSLVAMLYLDVDGTGFYMSVNPGVKMDFNSTGNGQFNDQVSSVKLVFP